MKSDSSSSVKTVLENGDIEDIKKRIQACCSGNISAKQQFQADFGELIYNFIRKVLKTREEKAADIYLYIFEGERLFKRLQSFREKMRLLVRENKQNNLN